MPTDAEIAWAAGLFEGEGTFCYSPKHVRAQMNMTDFGPVERFHQIVGVGKVVEKPRQGPRYKDQLVWRVTDQAGVRHVFGLLRPWLSDRRIEQAEEALRKLEAGIAATQAKLDAACKNGHPRTPENTRTITRPSGYRYRRCITCEREGNRRARLKRDQLAMSLAEALKEET